MENNPLMSQTPEQLAAETKLLTQRMADMLSIHYPEGSLDPRCLVTVLLSMSCVTLQHNGGNEEDFKTIGKIIWDKCLVKNEAQY